MKQTLRLSAALLAAFLFGGMILGAQAASSSKGMPLAAILKLTVDRALKIAPEKKIRLAVLPLKATESQRYGDKGCGSYLTEKMFGALGTAGPGLRLFERSRLDAVLKEQALTASGLMDESEARKIGELAPIDYLLTGTFTRLDQSLAINARFLDVVSGEVVATLSENIELTPDLAGLFEDLQARPAASAPGNAAPPKDPCEAKWAPFSALMEDIGTQDKVDRLVKAAMAIPFEGPCGKIHFAVIQHLVRYKQHSANYRSFLGAVLPTIQGPDEDERGGAVQHYLEAEPSLDDTEWKAFLGLMAKSKHPWSYLDLLLKDKAGSEASRELQLNRIGILLKEAEAKRLGRPVPLESGRLFTQIMGRLKPSPYREKTKDLRPILNCYAKYGSRFGADNDKDLLNTLTGLYVSAEAKDRDQLLTWIGQRIAATTPSRDLASSLQSFYEGLIKEKGREKRPKVSEIPALPELRRLAELCGPSIAATLPEVINRETRIELQRFCLAHGIKGEAVPLPDTLFQQLGSEEVHERQEALRLLAALGPGASQAEPQVLKLLRRADVQSGWSGQMRYLQADLLDFVGVMRTRNPELITLLVRHLGSLESLLYEAASRSLARLGEPAVQALKAAYPTLEQHPKQEVAKTFGRMGSAAKAHLPWLRAQIDTAPNVYVKACLEDAIEAIESGTEKAPVNKARKGRP